MICAYLHENKDIAPIVDAMSERGRIDHTEV